MKYHIKTRVGNERIASFEHFQDRDICFEVLDNQVYEVGIDKEDDDDLGGRKRGYEIQAKLKEQEGSK